MNELQKRIVRRKTDHGLKVTDMNKEFCILHGIVSKAYDSWEKNSPDLGDCLADIVIHILGISEIEQIDLIKEIDKKIEDNETTAPIIRSQNSSPQMRDYFMDGMK